MKRKRAVASTASAAASIAEASEALRVGVELEPHEVPASAAARICYHALGITLPLVLAAGAVSLQAC